MPALPPGPPRPIRTPCVQVCFLDDESGLCLGCLRSGEEIALWTRFSDDQRAAIMQALPSRQTRIAADKRGRI